MDVGVDGYVLCMRWDNLFDDLEGQLESELTAEDVDLQAEEERLRLGRMTIRDRIASIHDAEGSRSEYAIRLVLASGQTISIRPVALGKDWVSGDIVDGSSRHSQCIVPLATLLGIILERSQIDHSLRAQSDTQASRGLSARLSLAFVLRDLCRRRRAIELFTPGGALHGTIDRVGRDHLDLAVHERGTPRRESAVTQHRVVPLGQIHLVRL